MSSIGLLRNPYRMNFAITKECHSKCRHCSIWKSGRRPDELSIEEIRGIASSYPHLSWISLTGGEPTDRSDLPEIAEAFFRGSHALYLLNFSTNGLHRKRVLAQVKKILQIGIPKVMVAVSIDGPKEYHDSIRGIPGGFELAAETLKELLEISHGRRDLQVFASMTLYPENAPHAEALYGSLAPLVPGLTPRNIHFNLGSDRGHLYEKEGEFTFPSFSQKLPRAGIWHSSFSQYFLENCFQRMIPRFLKSGKTPVSCAAVNASIHLDETGNLYPCTIWKQLLGNIRSKGPSISSLLKGDEAAEAKAMIANGQCPQCWSPCEAYQSIAASPVRSAVRSLWPSRASPTPTELPH